MAEQPATPQRWYQWFLLYPALLLSIGGGLGSAIPAVWNEVKAYRLGVQSSKIQIAQEQQLLWEGNLDCLRLKPVYAIEIDDGVEVGVTLCPSGAALLRYQRAPTVVSYTWIPYPTSGGGGVGEQQHSSRGDVLTPQTRVVWGGTHCVSVQGRVVLWVLIDDLEADQCHAEYVSTVRGALLKHRPVPCGACS